MNKPEQDRLPDPDQLPFVAPCNKLPLTAAVGWIKLGYMDFKKTLGISLSYGLVLVVTSYILTILSWYLGGAVLLFSLLSGLVFIAPVLALGLYSVSCQIEEGYKPKLGFCIREGKHHLGNELIYSVVLLIIFLLWARAGSAIHIFFPMEVESKIEAYIIFYTVGSIIGTIFAALVFCASAFSLPMMMDRKADAITAVLTSVNAVRTNMAAMFIWALIIVIFIIVSFMTAYLGLAITMPILGYATWHGYKQTINAELWEENIKINEQSSGMNKATR